MRYKGYVVTYADEQLKVNKENFFVNGKCREDLEQLDVFQMNKNFARRNFYAVTSGVKCDEAGDELSQVAVDVMKGFYGSDFAEESRSYFGMANSAITGQVLDRKDKHFEVDISVLYIENDIATVYNFGDMPVFYYEKNNLKKLSGRPPQSVEIEKPVYDNKGIPQLQILNKNNIPHIGFSDEECESVSYVSESVKLKHAAYFLLCSKSVLDVVGEDDIKKILADKKTKGGSKATQIIDNAVKKKPNGNYTVLVVQVDNGIPIAEAEAKSVSGWAIVALLCAILYFASPYILRAVSVAAEGVKSFVEHYFGDEVEPEGDLKWTPREDEEEHQVETPAEDGENIEQSSEAETTEPNAETPHTGGTSAPPDTSTSQPDTGRNEAEEQPSAPPAEPEPVPELPGTTTPPVTTEEVELPIDFN